MAQVAVKRWPLLNVTGVPKKLNFKHRKFLDLLSFLRFSPSFEPDGDHTQYIEYIAIQIYCIAKWRHNKKRLSLFKQQQHVDTKRKD